MSQMIAWPGASQYASCVIFEAGADLYCPEALNWLRSHTARSSGSSPIEARGQELRSF
jgi:hypothetical protein